MQKIYMANAGRMKKQKLEPSKQMSILSDKSSLSGSDDCRRGELLLLGHRAHGTKLGMNEVEVVYKKPRLHARERPESRGYQARHGGRERKRHGRSNLCGKVSRYSYRYSRSPKDYQCSRNYDIHDYKIEYEHEKKRECRKSYKSCSPSHGNCDVYHEERYAKVPDKHHSRKEKELYNPSVGNSERHNGGDEKKKATALKKLVSVDQMGNPYGRLQKDGPFLELRSPTSGCEG
jgi:hypothetical protein